MDCTTVPVDSNSNSNNRPIPQEVSGGQSISRRSLPRASTAFNRSIIVANDILECAKIADVEQIKRAAEALVDDAPRLMREAMDNKKFTESIGPTESLIKALELPTFRNKAELRYMVARLIRSFAELTLIEVVETDVPIPGEYLQVPMDGLAKRIKLEKNSVTIKRAKTLAFRA